MNFAPRSFSALLKVYLGWDTDVSLTAKKFIRIPFLDDFNKCSRHADGMPHSAADQH